jgi:hypothetical protein
MTPWDKRPFILVNWWDMADFKGSLFCVICSYLAGIVKEWQTSGEKAPTDTERQNAIKNIAFVASQCEDAGLLNIATYIKDQIPLVDYQGVAFSDYVKHFGNLQGMLQSEMRSVKFLRVDRQNFYGSDPQFESFVTDIYPILTYDIVEAGNCLALERTTACVFHLMRIVEFCVQKLGEKLGVPLVNESVWQKIMDQVDSRIRDMPEKPAAKKRLKEKYADVAGHLYNVKVAWRNPVMHPKRTYTAEEAEHLFTTVRMFTELMVRLLKPKSVKKARESLNWLAEMEELSLAGPAKGLYGLKPAPEKE